METANIILNKYAGACESMLNFDIGLLNTPLSLPCTEMSGTCEYHGGYSASLTLCFLHDTDIKRITNKTLRNYIGGATYLCARCIEAMSGFYNKISVNTKVNNIKIDNMTFSDRQKKIASVFLRLRNSFEPIRDVYIVPAASLPECYKNELNIAIELPGFSVLSYTAWALREKKSVMFLWTSGKERSKFWPSKVTRLLIALGRMQFDADGLNIWMRSYGRLFHINYFVYPPQHTKQYKVLPEHLIRLCR